MIVDTLTAAEFVVVFTITGILLGIGGLRLPLARLQGTGVLWLLGAYVLLVAVLIPGLGIRVNGAQRWLDLGLFRVLVAEPAMLMLLVSLAAYLARHGEQLRARPSGFMLVLVLVGLTGALLLQQPNVGAAVLLPAIAMGMLRRAGARVRQLAGMLGLFLLVWWLLTWPALWAPHRMWSMATCFGPCLDPYSSGCAFSQSWFPVDWGEWVGSGLGVSQWPLWALELARSDWMFSLLAQELGLLGPCAVVLLYAVVVWRAFAIARQASRAGNAFASLLAQGIGIWIGLQGLLHIAVNLRLQPAMSWTLPLLSYGGSNLAMTCIAIALLLRADLETRPVSDAG